METAYVEQRDGGYWIKGTRISLDSVIYEFNSGAAPESIRRSYPLLSLEEVYGAITFYLSHQHEIDDYLAASEVELEHKTDQMNAKARTDNPELFERLDKARREREATLDLIDS
jgi:uncharacterized protein (DUF433 family)